MHKVFPFIEIIHITIRSGGCKCVYDATFHAKLLFNSPCVPTNNASFSPQ